MEQYNKVRQFNCHHLSQFKNNYYYFTCLLEGNLYSDHIHMSKVQTEFHTSTTSKLVHVGYFIVVSGDGCIQVQHLMYPMAIAPTPPALKNTINLTK